MKIESLCISALDLQQSKSFWIDVIGLDLVSEHPGQAIVGDGVTELILDGEISAPIELILGLDEEEFESLVAKLRDNGAEILRDVKDWGGPLGLEITVLDPAGNRVCIHKK